MFLQYSGQSLPCLLIQATSLPRSYWTPFLSGWNISLQIQANSSVWGDDVKTNTQDKCLQTNYQESMLSFSGNYFRNTHLIMLEMILSDKKILEKYLILYYNKNYITQTHLVEFPSSVTWLSWLQTGNSHQSLWLEISLWIHPFNFNLTWGGQVKDGEQQKPPSTSERRAEGPSSCQRQKSEIHPQPLLYWCLRAGLFSRQVTNEGPWCQVNIYCGTLSTPPNNAPTPHPTNSSHKQVWDWTSGESRWIHCASDLQSFFSYWYVVTPVLYSPERKWKWMNLT